MKNIKVRVKDEYTLELLEDGLKGDLINLREINKVDLSVITKLINDNKDLLYLKKLEEVKDSFNLEKKIIIKEAKEELELENNLLKEKLKSVEENIKLKLESNFNLELNKKELEIEKLKSSLNEANNLKDLEYKEKLNNLIRDKDVLLNEKNQLITNHNLTLENELNKLRDEQRDLIYKLREENENLKRERSSLNVKVIGENLEKWCDNEFRSNYLVMPENILWQKDNEVVSGTKADFVYKVFLDNEKKDSELLTSAILEMKSEDPNAPNKQNLDRILKKLNDDRNKKNLEYAILVSELDWHENNNVPVEKVLEYDKMFIVRPPYFMTLLNIITAFGYKYKDILINNKKEELKFKDINNILEEFESLKNEILDNSVKHINTHVSNILKETENIKKANLKIIESSNIILETHLKTIINKINEFKINKIVKDIDSL